MDKGRHAFQRPKSPLDGAIAVGGQQPTFLLFLASGDFAPENRVCPCQRMVYICTFPRVLGASQERAASAARMASTFWRSQLLSTEASKSDGAMVPLYQLLPEK